MSGELLTCCSERRESRADNDWKHDVRRGAGLWSNFYVIGWEESVRAPTHAPPPALVDHLDVGYNVIRIEGDLVFTRW